MNEFLRLCLLDDLIRIFQKCLYFYHNYWWESGKNKFWKYFWGLYLKRRRKFFGKFCTLNNLNTQKRELHTKSENSWVIKIFSLFPSTQNSHLRTWTFLVLIFFYFALMIASSDFEFSRVKGSGSHFISIT